MNETKELKHEYFDMFGKKIDKRPCYRESVYIEHNILKITKKQFLRKPIYEYIHKWKCHNIDGFSSYQYTLEDGKLVKSVYTRPSIELVNNPFEDKN